MGWAGASPFRPHTPIVVVGDLTNRLKMAERALLKLRARLAELGPLRLDDGVIYAGDTRISGNQALVERIRHETFCGCTVFLGNVRVATTATQAGHDEPALGTAANDEVSELVFGRGEVFRGVTQTIGRVWVIVYEPLCDASGARIGMIAAFRERWDGDGDGA